MEEIKKLNEQDMAAVNGGAAEKNVFEYETIIEQAHLGNWNILTGTTPEQR